MIDFSSRHDISKLLNEHPEGPPHGHGQFAAPVRLVVSVRSQQRFDRFVRNLPGNFLVRRRTKDAVPRIPENKRMAWRMSK